MADNKKIINLKPYDENISGPICSLGEPAKSTDSTTKTPEQMAEYAKNEILGNHKQNTARMKKSSVSFINTKSTEEQKISDILDEIAFSINSRSSSNGTKSTHINITIPTDAEMTPIDSIPCKDDDGRDGK